MMLEHLREGREGGVVLHRSSPTVPSRSPGGGKTSIPLCDLPHLSNTINITDVWTIMRLVRAVKH